VPETKKPESAQLIGLNSRLACKRRFSRIYYAPASWLSNRRIA